MVPVGFWKVEISADQYMIRGAAGQGIEQIKYFISNRSKFAIRGWYIDATNSDDHVKYANIHYSAG